VTSQFLPSRYQPIILSPSPPRTLLLDSVPTLHGLGPASEKRPSTRASKRRPRKPLGSLWVESRFLIQNLRLLLQLLHQGLRRASRSFGRKGTIIFNIFFYGLTINPQASMQSASRYPFGLICKEPCDQERVPKVDKPTSPSARKTFPDMSKPPAPEDTNASASATCNPTSPSATDLGRDVAHQSSWPDPTKHQEASPEDPKSFRLGARGGPQAGECSSMPRIEKQLRQYSRVAESLWDNPDFIQASYHIGRYVSASVNTEIEWELIKALYSSMRTTSKLVDVSIYASPHIVILRSDSSLVLAVVKHSQDKDQFLKVSIKRMQETQIYEDELKEVNEYNSVLSTRLQELETKCAEESQLKEGNFLLPFYLANPIISKYTLD
jgi:hypothetical protein